MDNLLVQWLTAIGQTRRFYKVLNSEPYDYAPITITASDLDILLTRLETNQDLGERTVEQWQNDNQSILDSIREAVETLADSKGGYDKARKFLVSENQNEREMALGYLRDMMNLQLQLKEKDDALALALAEISTK